MQSILSGEDCGDSLALLRKGGYGLALDVKVRMIRYL